jgi:hypothetical protein
MNRILMFLALVSLTAGPLRAISSQITFQGTLKQDSVPVNANKNMQFSFVDASGATIPGTTPITVANVQVTNGLFAVQLPMDPTINWQAFTPYIQVSVEGQILSPNQPLTSNLYAIVSQTVVDGAIGTAKIADSAVTTPKLADASVTTAKLDSGVQGITVPSGLIAMFAGPCPSGWSRFAALDNAFPMGGPTYGSVGGSATHTHTIATDGAHNHGYFTHAMADNNNEGGSGPYCSRFNMGDYGGGCGGAGTDAGHRHGINTDGAHNHGGATGSASSLPPYIEVVFCQKNP